MNQCVFTVQADDVSLWLVFHSSGKWYYCMHECATWAIGCSLSHRNDWLVFSRSRMKKKLKTRRVEEGREGGKRVSEWASSLERWVGCDRSCEGKKKQRVQARARLSGYRGDMWHPVWNGREPSVKFHSSGEGEVDSSSQSFQISSAPYLGRHCIGCPLCLLCTVT